MYGLDKLDKFYRLSVQFSSVAQPCPTLQPHGLYPTRLLCPWDSPGKNTRVGSLSLFQGIFPIQGSNPGLLHCRRILYSLNHQGSPGMLEWVADPFSRGSSPTQESNRGLLHCRWILYQLSYKRSPCSNLKT